MTDDRDDDGATQTRTGSPFEGPFHDPEGVPSPDEMFDRAFDDEGEYRTLVGANGKDDEGDDSTGGEGGDTSYGTLRDSADPSEAPRDDEGGVDPNTQKYTAEGAMDVVRDDGRSVYEKGRAIQRAAENIALEMAPTLTRFETDEIDVHTTPGDVRFRVDGDEVARLYKEVMHRAADSEDGEALVVAVAADLAAETVDEPIEIAGGKSLSHWMSEYLEKTIRDGGRKTMDVYKATLLAGRADFRVGDAFLDDYDDGFQPDGSAAEGAFSREALHAVPEDVLRWAWDRRLPEGDREVDDEVARARLTGWVRTLVADVRTDIKPENLQVWGKYVDEDGEAVPPNTHNTSSHEASPDSICLEYRGWYIGEVPADRFAEAIREGDHYPIVAALAAPVIHRHELGGHLVGCKVTASDLMFAVDKGGNLKNHMPDQGVPTFQISQVTSEKLDESPRDLPEALAMVDHAMNGYLFEQLVPEDPEDTPVPTKGAHANEHRMLAKTLDVDVTELGEVRAELDVGMGLFDIPPQVLQDMVEEYNERGGMDVTHEYREALPVDDEGDEEDTGGPSRGMNARLELPHPFDDEFVDTGLDKPEADGKRIMEEARRQSEFGRVEMLSDSSTMESAQWRRKVVERVRGDDEMPDVLKPFVSAVLDVERGIRGRDGDGWGDPASQLVGTEFGKLVAWIVEQASPSVEVVRYGTNHDRLGSLTLNFHYRVITGPRMEGFAVESAVSTSLETILEVDEMVGTPYPMAAAMAADMLDEVEHVREGGREPAGAEFGDVYRPDDDYEPDRVMQMAVDRVKGDWEDATVHDLVRYYEGDLDADHLSDVDDEISLPTLERKLAQVADSVTSMIDDEGFEVDQALAAASMAIKRFSDTDSFKYPERDEKGRATDRSEANDNQPTEGSTMSNGIEQILEHVKKGAESGAVDEASDAILDLFRTPFDDEEIVERILSSDAGREAAKLSTALGLHYMCTAYRGLAPKPDKVKHVAGLVIENSVRNLLAPSFGQIREKLEDIVDIAEDMDIDEVAGGERGRLAPGTDGSVQDAEFEAAGEKAGAREQRAPGRKSGG